MSSHLLAINFRDPAHPEAGGAELHLEQVLLEALIPFAYARCRFVAISESTRDDLVARGIARERVTVVHCGLDHERYRVDPAVAKAARPTLVFVGRLRRYKGLDWVMRSLPALL